MDSGKPDIPKVPLPPDNRPIDQALADLDAKTAAWSVAIADAQATLNDAAARHAKSAGKLDGRKISVVESDNVTAQPTNISDQGTAANTSGPAQVGRQEAPQAGQHAAEQEAAPLSSEVQSDQAYIPAGNETEGIDRSGGQAPVTKHPSGQVDEPSQSDAAVAEPAAMTEQEADDEALLASLDQTTTEKIHIMRRMSSKKISVRQLLERLKLGH